MNLNFYLVFILTCIGGVFFLETLADLLNLKFLKGELPQEFQGTYDPEKYSKSLQYQSEGVHFELIRRTLFVVTTLLFILLGGFELVDHAARSFELNSLVTGLLFAGTLSGLKLLLSLPFSIYETFVIEEKYGFNKTTPKIFAIDLIKGLILGSILGGLIFSGIILFFENSGPYAWLYCWIALSAFQLILVYLAPAVIMPLFNKFEPLPEGSLRSAIESYAKTRNFTLSGIFTMDNSKRSTKSNAFFTGFGKFRRLVLFDTLISKHTEQELVAVLAHEIGHFEKKHIVKSMILSVITTGILFYTFSFFLENSELFAAFKMSHVSVYASIIFVSILYGPILRILSLFTQKLSRKHEFEADEFAVQTFGHPELLISALKKLSVDNLSHLTPHPLKVLLDYTHPPILKRIESIRKHSPFAIR